MDTWTCVVCLDVLLFLQKPWMKILSQHIYDKITIRQLLGCNKDTQHIFNSFGSTKWSVVFLGVHTITAIRKKAVFNNGALLKQHYVTLTTTHCFEKWNLTMRVNTLHKTAILVKPGHILHRKRPLVFPLMSYNCFVCLQPFILAELPPAATRCCSCSFGLQEACMLLSGTSVNHRVEAEQL